MGKLTVTPKVPDEMKAAGFEYAVAYKHDDEHREFVACFKNRFDAIMFMHANRIKEQTGVETGSHSRKETASAVSS